ncbi:MAG: hypothetical protein ACI3XZ_05350 [Butyricicoccus sp.]
MSKSTQEAPRRRPKKPMKTWQRVLFHWRLPLIIVLVLMILSGVAVHTVSAKLAAREQAKQDAAAQAEAEAMTYEEAVVDALQAEQTEVQDLVCLVSEDGRVTYDAETDRVQLVFWTNAAAENFKKDSQVTLDDYTYAYADLELASWGAANKDVLKNGKEARLVQLFGQPEGSAGTTFVVVSVTPERVLRAAYQPDAQLKKMSLAFEETVDQDFISWFNNEINESYFTNPRPWTRLGYTYDWGASGDEHYGVTEFVIPAGTKVTIKGTFTNDEMITRLRKGKIQ